MDPTPTPEDPAAQDAPSNTPTSAAPVKNAVPEGAASASPPPEAAEADASTPETPESDPVGDDSELRRRPPYVAIAAATVLVVLTFNGAWLLWGDRPPKVQRPPSFADVLAEQIAAVDDGESNAVEIQQYEITNDDLRPLHGLAGLRTLIIDRGIITDEGMETVASLPDLSHLRLRRSPISDEGLELILHRDSLRVLNLPHSRLTAEAVARLAELPNLRQLRIGGRYRVDLSPQIAQLVHLRALHLVDVPVTDDGLQQLASLPHLESLYLDGASVTEAGWQWLFQNHPQLHVHINQQHHDRDPARHRHREEEPRR